MPLRNSYRPVLAELETHSPLAIYVHWPFCQAKCPYCDFNSHVSQSIDQADWGHAYEQELERYAAETHGRLITSVFFGGGTPSLMDPTTVSRVITKIRSLWPTTNNIEITLEANPTSVEADKFAGFKDAGINRVSVGVQALNDGDLRRLGRMHSVEEALSAVALARETFSSVSFDLIYARQDQTLEDWRSELSQALSFEPDHLSMYQLTIEPGTVFGQRFDRGQLRGLPDEDLAADMYEFTTELTADAGLTAYEVSNYARPGHESLHNMTYWQGGDWIGIGPGAHGRFSIGGQRMATTTHLYPANWLAAVHSGSGEDARRALSTHEHADEYVMMGLRMSDGISVSNYAEIAGRELSNVALQSLSEAGMVVQAGDRLSTTHQGRMLLNQVVTELLT